MAREGNSVDLSLKNCLDTQYTFLLSFVLYCIVLLTFSAQSLDTFFFLSSIVHFLEHETLSFSSLV